MYFLAGTIKHTEGHRLTYPAIGLPVLDSTIHAEAYTRVDSLLLHVTRYGRNEVMENS